MYNLFIKKKLFAKYPYLPKSVFYNIQTFPEEITSGSGSYERNSFVTVSTIVPNGYKFTGWTENNNIVSTKLNYTFIINSDRELVANFEENTHTVTTSVNPTGAGTTTGSGIYTRGDSVTVNATANSGYNFVNWTEDGNVVSTNSQYTFTITNNRNLIANFEEVIYKYKISVCQYDPIDDVGTILSFADSKGMTIPNPGEYTCKYNDTENGKINITANEIQGYEFKAWKINKYNENDITSPAQNFRPDAQIDITTEFLHYIARYEIKTFNINVESPYEDEGTVSGGGVYKYNTPVTIKAIAKDGYVFDCWKRKDNNIVINNANESYTFNVTEDITLVAIFKEDVSKLMWITPEENAKIGFQYNNSSDSEIYYSIDEGQTFNIMSHYTHGSQQINAIDVPKNTNIYFKGIDNNGGGRFIISQPGNCTSFVKFNIYGDISTLKCTTHESMFSGQFVVEVSKNLLSNISLSERCFYLMFSGCKYLIQAPNLPATTLVKECYKGMFTNCIELTQPPAMEATTSAEEACSGMFQGCTKLERSPIIKMKTLASNCCYKMFYNCENLNYVTSYIDKDYLGNDYTEQWLYNVSSPGTYYDRNTQILNNLLIDRSYNTVPEPWNIDDGIIS